MATSHHPPDTHAILEELERVRGETLRLLAPLTQADLDWRPPLNEGEAENWSPGEIFMHLALDEHYLREHLARPLLEGVKPPEAVQFIPPPPPYGAAKEVIEFWFDRARRLTRRMLDTLPPDANLDLKHAGGLDEMNGLEWLLGYASHEAFHHRQIAAVVEQLPSRQAVGA